MGGEPKALLEIGGRRIVERVVAAVGAVLDDLLVVTNTPEHYAFLGLPMVGDDVPDGGALGGIYTGLRVAGGGAAFTVACDMPFVHPALVRLMVERADEGDVIIPRVDGQYETMHAVYAKACLPHMRARLDRGQLKIAGFFDAVRVVEVPAVEVARHRAPALAFINVNTPEDLARARALAQGIG